MIAVLPPIYRSCASICQFLYKNTKGTVGRSEGETPLSGHTSLKSLWHPSDVRTYFRARSQFTGGDLSYGQTAKASLLETGNGLATWPLEVPPIFYLLKRKYFSPSLVGNTCQKSPLLRKGGNKLKWREKAKRFFWFGKATAILSGTSGWVGKTMKNDRDHCYGKFPWQTSREEWSLLILACGAHGNWGECICL